MEETLFLICKTIEKLFSPMPVVDEQVGKRFKLRESRETSLFNTINFNWNLSCKSYKIQFHLKLIKYSKWARLLNHDGKIVQKHANEFRKQESNWKSFNSNTCFINKFSLVFQTNIFVLGSIVGAPIIWFQMLHSNFYQSNNNKNNNDNPITIINHI